MSTLILLPKMSPKETREYFSRYLSELKDVREQHGGSKRLDDMIVRVETILAELEDEK